MSADPWAAVFHGPAANMPAVDFRQAADRMSLTYDLRPELESLSRRVASAMETHAREEVIAWLLANGYDVTHPREAIGIYAASGLELGIAKGRADVAEAKLAVSECLVLDRARELNELRRDRDALAAKLAKHVAALAAIRDVVNSEHAYDLAEAIEAILEEVPA